MTNLIGALEYPQVVGMLDAMYKPHDGTRRDFIIKYASENFKNVSRLLEEQYKERSINLSQATKDDIVIALIAQCISEQMQTRYNADMDARTVAITVDTTNVAGVSGYKDEIAAPGYKREKAVAELVAKNLTKESTFRAALSEQAAQDEKKGLLKEDTVKDNANSGGGRGFFYGSHAERELSHRTDRPIGVSRRMCNECVRYFRSLQSQRIVADPDFIWIFEPNSKIMTLLNKATQKQLETKLKNFQKKY